MTKETEEIETRLLLEAIHTRYGYDFRNYAPQSISRRLERARQHFQCDSLSMLQHRILHDPAVLPEVVGLLTIQVSEMFRDPDFFRAIRHHVIPHLATFPSLKVWVAGCAEGEEVYSLAILFREEGLEARTMFYATDISPAALATAEAGIYPIDRLPLFTQNHQKSGAQVSLSRYYTAAYGGAAFDRSLRERVVFSDHSLISDQVFAEVHLVSCRNVLIYFDDVAKERAIRLFSDSLVRGGFLALGSSETLSLSTQACSFHAIFGRSIYRKLGQRPSTAGSELRHA